MKLGHNNVPPKYNQEQVDFIVANVKGITLEELKKRFNKKFNLNVSDNAIAHLKYKYGLKSGIVGGRFEKGMTPFNKGKKWDDFMPKESQNNSRKTTFKKGNIPKNRAEMSEERIRKGEYVYLKVKDGAKNKNWVPKHRYIYESIHGKIPEHCKVIFADGDKNNFKEENLILVSNSQEFIMNKNNLIKKGNIEFTKTGKIIAEIIDKSNKLVKKNERL